MSISIEAKINSIINEKYGSYHSFFTKNILPSAIDFYNQNLLFAIKLIDESKSIHHKNLKNTLFNITKSKSHKEFRININSANKFYKKHNLFKTESWYYILLSILSKAYNQLYGSAIISNNKNYKLKLEIIINLINITDVIDTITDLNPKFVNKSLDEKIKYSNIFFGYYLNLFEETSVKQIDEFKNELSYIRDQTNHTKKLIKKLNISAKIKGLIVFEMKRYINGVVLMDNNTVNFDHNKYIDLIASKISNLSLLGLIDKSDVEINHSRFISAIRELHVTHICEDDLRDFEFDKNESQLNIWNYSSPDEISHIAEQKLNSFIEGLSEMPIETRDKWIYIALLKIQYYYQTDLKSDKLNKISYQYYNNQLEIIHNVQLE